MNRAIVPVSTYKPEALVEDASKQDLIVVTNPTEWTFFESPESFVVSPFSFSFLVLATVVIMLVDQLEFARSCWL